MRRLGFSFFLLLFCPIGLMAHPGKKPYAIYCSACHARDYLVAGPPLTEIAKTYPIDKKQEFIAWAKAPGKKNPKLIKMPPMAHVPEKELADIHDYILHEIKEGQPTKEEDKREYTPFTEPQRELPYAIRTSMPDSSPASVAVVLKNGLTLCWDTELCRVRYVYVGSVTNLFTMWRPPTLPNQPFYNEVREPLFSGKEKPSFLGYRLINGYPEFQYQIGEVQVRELIGSESDVITRTFNLSGESSDQTLKLSPEGGTLETSQGTLENGELTLTADQAKSFTLTLKKK